jgi:mediator of RNA polymerase II transcription subunit 23
MLAKVDKEKKTSTLRHMDTICDLLYHVKYQFTGDSIRADAERVEKELSSPLQLRLRFIAPVTAQRP